MKRKLKTIQKILEENPGAFFDDHGRLHEAGASKLITASMYSNFGSEIDVRSDFSFKAWNYDENWFEPIPEPKKLYAFRNKLGWILHRIDEKGEDLTRDPDYDITPNQDNNNEQN